MELLSCVLCFLAAWASIYIMLSVRRGSKHAGYKLPPGPVPLPVIGNLLCLGSKPHESLANLATTYGPVMTLRLGHVTTVVISSAAMAREVLQKQDLSFCNRPAPDAIRTTDHNQLSVVWMPVSATWRVLRKTCNALLFTSKKLDSNTHIRGKVQELLANVEQNCQAGGSVHIARQAFTTSLNLLSRTIFSVDLVDPSSETAQEFQELFCSMTEAAGKPNLVDYFPVLRLIDPQGIRRGLTIKFDRMFGIFDTMIKQRLVSRKILEDSVAESNVLDSLLIVSEDNSNEIGRSHIKHLLLDLFVAGTDTTSSTVEWAMAELLRNPEKLLKARTELLQNIGKDREVKELDMARLPYLQAVVKETFRLHPAIPLLLPRKVEEDTHLCGFTVPRKAQVLVNAWAIGRDPNTWENPSSFVPERFLGLEMDVKGQNFELIPFGGGRRICLGMPLAIRMVHLILASLLHSYDWKLEDGVTPENLNMEERFGVSLHKAHPLKAIPMRV